GPHISPLPPSRGSYPSEPSLRPISWKKAAPAWAEYRRPQKAAFRDAALNPVCSPRQNPCRSTACLRPPQTFVEIPAPSYNPSGTVPDPTPAWRPPSDTGRG